MKIEIVDRQKLVGLNVRRIRGLTGFLMGQACQAQRPVGWDTIAVVLVNDSGIMQVNRVCLDRSAVTDVISFALAAMPGRGGRRTGEIVINVQRALEAGAGCFSASRELGLYIAHGCDHLTGANDRTPLARKRMRRRELRWLRMAKREGLLGCLLR